MTDWELAHQYLAVALFGIEHGLGRSR
jgi:hypothetical protein